MDKPIISSETEMQSTWNFYEETMQLINEVYNPSTLAFLRKFLKPGMRVLDVGCGSGIVSCEIAKLIGPEGKVVGIDNIPSQIEMAKARSEKDGVENTEFIFCSAQEVTQLQQQFDAIYSRYLLVYLADQMAVIDRFMSILSPSGLLLLEEAMGLDTLDCFPEKTETFETYRDFLEKQYGLLRMDSSVGRYLPRMLDSKGLLLKNIEFAHPMLRTARQKSLLRTNLEAQIPGFKENGPVTPTEARELCDLLPELEQDYYLYVSYFENIQVAAEKQ